MLVKKRELPILLVNLAYILSFGLVSVWRLNYEFMIYVGVVVLFLCLIAATQRRVGFSRTVLWGLTAWGFMHLAGGTVYVGGARLYELILFPLLPAQGILRYDQFVHAFGFGAATLVAYHLLRPRLRERPVGWGTLSVLIVLMGMGLGALNEVIEFGVVLVAPEAGVGGYLNTALDLVFNMLGAVMAVCWINVQRRRQKSDLPAV